MGYDSGPLPSLGFIASDDMIITDASDETTNAAFPTKIKEFTLVGAIAPQSVFRYKFGMYASGGPHTGANGRIYRNGLAVGTSQTTDSSIEVTFTEDILTASWQIGDKIQLYAWNDKGNTTHVLNLNLCGIGSQWILT